MRHCYLYVWRTPYRCAIAITPYPLPLVTFSPLPFLVTHPPTSLDFDLDREAPAACLFLSLPTTRAKSLASCSSPVLPGDERSPPSPPTRRAPQPQPPPNHGPGGGSPGTIAAVVTSLGGGPAAVGIVRLSGADAVAVVARVFRPAGNWKGPAPWRPRSHFLEYGFALDGDGGVIDELPAAALLLCFRLVIAVLCDSNQCSAVISRLVLPNVKVLVVPMLAPRSYTREDVVELQCHGNDLCLRRVLSACLEAGARLADPGEFTLCAFLNGRLDLAQAENVSRLISAKSVAAADSALAGIQIQGMEPW